MKLYQRCGWRAINQRHFGVFPNRFDSIALTLYAGTIDENFDRETETAVKAFQQSANLTVDGEVGPNTWRALFGEKAFIAPRQDLGDLPILAVRQYIS